MSSASTYIILSSTAIGGVEKRLAGLFLHLAAQGHDVRLVLSSDLLSLLERGDEHAAIRDHRARLEIFQAAGAPFERLRAFLRGLFVKAPAGVFHYGLPSPLRLHASRSRRTLFTLPNASLALYNARGLLEVYGGILRASRVDVLDPRVFAQLTSQFFWRRGSFSLTPGSYVDLELYRPVAAGEKQNLIVFSGLFSDEKQAPRLVACIPRLLERLDAAGFQDARIVMLGRDPDGGTVSARVASLRNSRVEARFEPSPRSVLAGAKVFLSLQRSTNHPSKALLEAMACGCAPVVTDTRDSRLSAPDSLARYVPRDFSADDIADACVALLQRSSSESEVHVDAARSFLRARFSIDTMAAYYCHLYSQLRALPR